MLGVFDMIAISEAGITAKRPRGEIRGGACPLGAVRAAQGRILGGRSMKPLLRARLQSRRSRGFTLACDDDATIRVTALQPDLVRVTLLRGGEVRQRRTWSVPAYGESDTPWAGRARLDDSSWPAVPLELTATEAEL